MPGRIQSRWPITGRDAEIQAVVAALAEPDVDLVLMVGPAGVGKSRLAEACFDTVVSADPRRGGRAVASPSLRHVPFGAVAHLLPDEAVQAATQGGGPVQLFAALRAALSGVAPERYLLLIDDVQHLDEGSVGAIVQLLSGGLIRLLLTQRAGERLPPGLVGILRSDGMMRVDLGALDLAETGELLRAALGGSVHTAAQRELFERSQGNPLYLRELVQSAVESGALVEREGIWVLAREVVGSGMLLDMLNEKLAALTREGREAAELLSLAQPIGLALLERVYDLTTLATLEESGIIEVGDDGNRHEVRLAHPLYADILTAEMLAVTRRRLLLRHVALVEEVGARRREDTVRLVLWRLEAGGSAPVAELVQAARTAWAGKDVELTRRLAEAALEAGARAEVIGPLGDALYELGEFERGAALVRDALAVETDELRIVELAISLHRLLLWGLDDGDGALQVLVDSATRLHTEPFREVLLAAEANVLAFTGRPAEALDRIAHIRYLVPPISTIAAVARSAACSQLGRTAEAIEVAAQGYREQLDASDAAAVFNSALQLIAGSFALTEAGRVQEGFEMASTAYDAVVDVDILLDQAWAAVNAARALLVAGRPVSARRWAQEALAAAMRAGFTTGVRLSWALFTAASGQLGDVAAARSGLAQLDRAPQDAGFAREETAVGVAWARHALDDTAGGCAALREAAAGARERGLVSSESFLLHEAVRLGDASGADRLAELAAVSDSALAEARALHARAVAAGDAALLQDAADAFEALGCDLTAAESCLAAARAQADDGDDRAVGRLTQRAAALLDLCEGATTPALHTPGGPVATLSAREQEVAQLAAAGFSSREIAARLFLSVRTVDNHLQHVYTKLGIRGRADIADAIAR